MPQYRVHHMRSTYASLPCRFHNVSTKEPTPKLADAINPLASLNDSLTFTIGVS